MFDKIGKLPTAQSIEGVERVVVLQDGIAKQAPAKRIGASNNEQGDTVFVSEVGDFPASVGGVIQLEDSRTYFLTGNIDLMGSRLVGGQNSVILGGSSENCVLSSTGLDSGTALLSSAYSLPCRFFAITHDTAINLDATGNSNQALDWIGVNFLNCATIGTVKNYGNAIFQICAHLNSQGMTFDGSIGTIGFTDCLFNPTASGTALTFPSTLTITRRFRVSYSAFVILSGETGINMSTSATVPVEGYILDTVNFAGGGTYITGVAFNDNKALFSNVNGVENSASVGQMTMQGNATATTIDTIGVAVKAAGATTLDTDITQKFSHSDNRLTYAGAITRRFKVSVVASVLASNNTQLGSYIAKNGSILTKSEIYTTADGNNRSENTAVQVITDLAENDYIEFFIENDTSTADVTVEDMSVIVEAL
jgi:hypothetical protein